MADSSRTHDWKRIEKEIQGPNYQQILQELTREHPAMQPFNTWMDVVDFMRKGGSEDTSKDLILRIIFQAHCCDQNHRWRTILLAIFWPALISIHWQKRHWDSDLDERWQNIVWTFLRVVSRLDPQRRRERIVQKVFNDTVHFLHADYRRQWNKSESETPMDLEDLSDLQGEEDVDLDAIDRRLSEEKEIQRLRFHQNANRLSEEDFLLIIGTRVYGQSMSAYAKLAGLNYQAAKKRRQRAELAIRKFEEDHHAS
jgi:DNA-directed RNA polymerase specialized sigma24 family protein